MHVWHPPTEAACHRRDVAMSECAIFWYLLLRWTLRFIKFLFYVFSAWLQGCPCYQNSPQLRFCVLALRWWVCSGNWRSYVRCLAFLVNGCACFTVCDCITVDRTEDVAEAFGETLEDDISDDAVVNSGDDTMEVDIKVKAWWEEGRASEGPTSFIVASFMPFLNTVLRAGAFLTGQSCPYL